MVVVMGHVYLFPGLYVLEGCPKVLMAFLRQPMTAQTVWAGLNAFWKVKYFQFGRIPVLPERIPWVFLGSRLGCGDKRFCAAL